MTPETSPPAPAPARRPTPQTLLTYAILGAMVLGLITGVMLNQTAGSTEWVKPYLTDGVFAVTGGLFMRLLKLLVVPLVFVSIVCGIISLTDLRKLGRMSVRTLVLYIGTTALAITLALAVGSITRPGVGIDPDAQSGYSGHAAAPLAQVLLEIVPDNPVAAMAQANMLQVIVFAVIVGLAIVQVGKVAAPVKVFFDALNEVVMRMVVIVMWFAPIGVFGLIARTFTLLGPGAIIDLGKYFFTVLGVLFLQLLVVYPLMLIALGRLNPLPFFRKMWRPQLNAFVTASSGATLPITLETVEHRLGAKNTVAGFTIPLGATINMDGTAIMQGVATVFVANFVGHDLTLVECATVVLMATLASIGTAAIPAVGMVTLSGVLVQVGLPLEPVGIIMGVDRLLDMTRTAVNVTGDAAVTCVVAKAEGDLEEAKYAEA